MKKIIRPACALLLAMGFSSALFAAAAVASSPEQHKEQQAVEQAAEKEKLYRACA